MPLLELERLRLAFLRMMCANTPTILEGATSRQRIAIRQTFRSKWPLEAGSAIEGAGPTPNKSGRTCWSSTARIVGRFERDRFCRSPCVTDCVEVCSGRNGRQNCRCWNSGVFELTRGRTIEGDHLQPDGLMRLVSEQSHQCAVWVRRQTWRLAMPRE